MSIFKRKPKKQKVQPIETTCLISDVGSLELVEAKALDQENLEVKEQEIYTGIPPVVLTVDVKALTTRKGAKWILATLLGRRIYTRVHYVRQGEIFSRDCHSGEYVDEERMKKVIDEHSRENVDVSRIQFITEECAEFRKSGVIKEFWRHAQGRGIWYWLPWIVCGVISLGFGVLMTVEAFLIIQILAGIL